MSSGKIRVTPRENGVLVENTDFSPVHTFECGQCFRFEADAFGVYHGVALGRALSVWRDEQGLWVGSSLEDFERLWRQYLDLDRDYAAINSALPTDSFTRAALDFGRGLRVLRQSPWEALCSFIISQCNNIPRIKSIISALCTSFGDQFEHNGQVYHSFPPPEALARLSAGDLSCLRAGYRAGYIVSAARDICEGRFSFERLEGLPTDAALREVMKLNGVGAKVANCFLLFGAGRMDAFPVDTWMKKASAFYPGGFPGFGENAGIAQQYIFYYARSGKK